MITYYTKVCDLEWQKMLLKQMFILFSRKTYYLGVSNIFWQLSYFWFAFGNQHKKYPNQNKKIVKPSYSYESYKYVSN
jgi:hypothetical protein